MVECITSSQNKMVKLAASLLQKKYRDETGLFLLEGIRLIEEAVQAGWSLECCLVTTEARSKERVLQILGQLSAQNIKLLQVPDEIFNKLTETQQPQGLVAIARKRDYTLADVFASKEQPLIVILESVQDPGNVGALIRTADAAGCSGVILTKGCADVYSGKTVRATMGSLFHLPIVSGVEENELITALKSNKIALFATSLATRNLYHDVNMSRPSAIVFGNEGSGVREEILQAADELMYIPIYGKAESLNVSASAAVILFEAMRQRQSFL